MKKVFLTLLSFFIMYTSFAQSKIAHGFVIDSITSTYIHGVRINNISNKYQARTNEYGRFGIRAEVSDKIEFFKRSFSGASGFFN